MAGPDWDTLYSVAAAQQGHFTTDQAADAGFSANAGIIRLPIAG